MSTEHDVARSLRSWLRENRHEDANRVLDAVLTEVDATPQRPAGWLARRIPLMKNTFRIALAAVAVVVVAIIGYQFLPSSGTGGPVATPTPTPTPTVLAVGSFTSHGAQIELDATGEGSNVTGSMTAVDEGGDKPGSFTVDLACTRTTDSGLTMIGGLVTDSTNYDDWAPVGSYVAIVLQRGSPVKAFLHSEAPDPLRASCPAFLEGIPDEGEPGFESSYLEPIEGTIELRP